MEDCSCCCVAERITADATCSASIDDSMTTTTLVDHEVVEFNIRCRRRTSLRLDFHCVRWAVTLFVVTLVTTMSSAAPVVASAAHPPTHKRWFYPCNGASPVVVVSDAAAVGDGASGDEMDSASSAELADSLHTISTKANHLKRHIRELKDLYVKQRFRDDSIVEDLEQMGIRLAGMPETGEATIDSVSNADMIETIHRAFEHLARVAVFVDQARIGEQLAANEPVSYERHFERIEDHHDHGLYWLLCNVQRVVRQTRRPIAGHVVDAVMRMRVVEVDRNSMRHTRDYLVLRDFERILERISVEFAALGQTRRRLQRRRHHHRTPADVDLDDDEDLEFDLDDEEENGSGAASS